jgi:type VI protein secretion system component Hcp
MAGDQRYFFLNMISAGIHGGSPKANHLDWLELDNWDFSMNLNADINVKSGRPDKTSAVGRFGFSIVHNGPYLFGLAASGQYIGETSPIVFEAERSGLTSGGGSTGTGVYLQLTFTKAVVSNRSLSGDDGQKMEHIELVFEKVSMMYKQVVNGVLGPATTKSYDAKTNRVS